MNKQIKLTAIFCLINGILLSIIAGGVSVYGMTLLFNAHAIVVGVMIGVIELGKLSASMWLKFNWQNRVVPRLHKAYLLCAVIVTMLITAVGTFGFLSAGYLEQKTPMAGLGIESRQYEQRIEQAEIANQRADKRLAQIDANINSFLESGAATRGLRASETLKKEREAIQKEIDANNAIINDMNGKLAPLKQESSAIEAKLGPIQYISQFLGYGDDPEVAVNIMILLITLTCDPLAVVLILSAMSSFKQLAEEQSPPVVPPLEPEPVKPEPSPEEPVTLMGGSEITIKASGEGVSDLSHDAIVGHYVRSFGKITDAEIPIDANGVGITSPSEREKLLDLLYQHPDVVAEIIEEAEKEKNTSTKTASQRTGWRED